MTRQSQDQHQGLSPRGSGTPSPRTTLETAQLVAAALAVACFFLPLVTISTPLFSYGLSMVDLFRGVSVIGLELAEPTKGAGLFVAAPVVAIALSLLLSRSKSWRGVPLLVAGVLLLVFCFRWGQAFGGYEGVSLSMGFYGYVLCGIVMVI